tara:strand:- start:41915 stop:42541 length:627 start_codon:yes stop_codon:yes gene_type:complete
VKYLSVFLIYISILFLAVPAFAQQTNNALVQEIKHYQDSLENDFRDRDISPLLEEDFNSFKGLEFYPIDTKYYIIADFKRTPNEKPFLMPTTIERAQKPVYEKYGEVSFSLDGRDIVLPVFQSHSLREQEEWKSYLFLPFRDKTNGKETYGGGRYLELWITGEDTIVVDFNRAYNPYCAYNYNYSCPIVPKENIIALPIYAGEKNFSK